MGNLTTPKFRVSFPHTFKPNSFEGGLAKYSVVMLFPKNTDLSKLAALAKKAVEDKWPDETKRPDNLRSPFRDGDKERADTDGYAGHYFITATSMQKPGVVDLAMNELITEDVGEDGFYAGCYAHASLTAYAYDKAGNKGVAFGLQNVQKLSEGEPFSGRSKPEDDFEAIDNSDMFGKGKEKETGSEKSDKGGINFLS